MGSSHSMKEFAGYVYTVKLLKVQTEFVLLGDCRTILYFQAKIMCSSICKCIGCKHYEESPEQKTLMAVPNYAEAGSFEGSHYVSGLPKFRKER